MLSSISCLVSPLKNPHPTAWSSERYVPMRRLDPASNLGEARQWVLRTSGLPRDGGWVFPNKKTPIQRNSRSDSKPPASTEVSVKIGEPFSIYPPFIQNSSLWHKPGCHNMRGFLGSCFDEEYFLETRI